jgi:hypothetical protein
MPVGAQATRPSWAANAFDWVMSDPWTSSAIEVLFAIIVSNLAILLSVFVVALMQEPSTPSDFEYMLLNTFRDTIGVQSILVYILGFSAPAMWIMVKNYRMWRHYGLLITLFVVQFFVVLTTSVIFALSIAKVLKNEALATKWGWICLVVALIVWYAILVYEKRTLRLAEKELDTPGHGSDDLLKALRGTK